MPRDVYSDAYRHAVLSLSLIYIMLYHHDYHNDRDVDAVCRDVCSDAYRHAVFHLRCIIIIIIIIMTMTLTLYAVMFIVMHTVTLYCELINAVYIPSRSMSYILYGLDVHAVCRNVHYVRHDLNACFLRGS